MASLLNEEEKMSERNNSIRGVVMTRWKTAGQPAWSKKKTLAVCVRVDQELESIGLQAAPQFRKAIKNQDQEYQDYWVFGCHFPWLNPR